MSLDSLGSFSSRSDFCLYIPYSGGKSMLLNSLGSFSSRSD